MSVTFFLEKPAALPSSPQPRRQHHSRAGGRDLGRESSSQAKRLAAAILEVLAGARTPSEAATALAVSLPRYYQLESRALQGLLLACEPKPKGRTCRPEHEASALRLENERLQREVTRQQSLTRAVQRSVGWTPPAPPAAKGGKKPRQRRVVRALSVAARLQESSADHPRADHPRADAACAAAVPPKEANP